MKIYLDTNVFVSLFREELDKNLRPLYLEAEEFFSYVSTKKVMLLLSDLFFKEVYKSCNVKRERVIKYFQDIDIPILIIEKDQQGKAVEGIHYPDSVHAGTAIKFNCDGIVTFNVKDFEKIKKIKVILPQDFQID